MHKQSTTILGYNAYANIKFQPKTCFQLLLIKIPGIFSW